MRGNSHVRFGAGDEETCLGDEARRFIPTLPAKPVRTLTLTGKHEPFRKMGGGADSGGPRRRSFTSRLSSSGRRTLAVEGGAIVF